MAWPGTLTPEEEAVVKVFIDEMFRPALLNFTKSLNICNGMNDSWTNQIQALFTKLSAADIIPLGNAGLVGSQSLTKSEVTALLSILNTFLTTNNTGTIRGQISKAIGPSNMIRTI